MTNRELLTLALTELTVCLEGIESDAMAQRPFRASDAEWLMSVLELIRSVLGSEEFQPGQRVRFIDDGTCGVVASPKGNDGRVLVRWDAGYQSRAVAKRLATLS